ncbi:hypothetical protein QUH71_26875 (plasmid) [Priestia aryabhattai]|uniref:hypothetical protein n=1 Tax=Priestia aryabhattai TaxID=412384 RepID=UPI0025A463FE|nr:hypothetical protein [Priestia aryabhattai]WJN47591.1 hypothetical protein QUH71_26875 [Priestia aryabhattai]
MGASYIALSSEFINGIEEWLKKKDVDKEHVVEVGAGMGELGRRLGLPERHVSDLRLPSSADYYNPLNNTGSYQDNDEPDSEDGTVESLVGNVHGFDRIITVEDIKKHGSMEEDTDNAEDTAEDVEFWDLSRAFGKKEEADETVKKADEIKLLIMGMPSDGKDDFSFFTAYTLEKDFPDAQILYIGPDLDGRFISRVASAEFFAHCTDITDDTFTSLVVNNYPEEISAFQIAQLGEEFASDIRPYLLKFTSCSCQDCKSLK